MTSGSKILVASNLASLALLMACTASADGNRYYDDQSLTSVAVQSFDDWRHPGKKCLVFTHDEAWDEAIQWATSPSTRLEYLLEHQR